MSLSHSEIRKHRGVTMVEMLVTLVIGLVLTGGLLQIFLSSKQSYRVQDSYTVLQSTGRFAMDLISKDLRQAGFPKSDLTIQTLVATGTVTVLNGINGANDELVVSFTATDNLDCAGNTVAGGIVVNAYYINDGVLVCLGNGGVSEFVIAEGVDGFQVLYGVDTDVEPDGVANQYVAADRVTTVGDWENVVTVKFAMLANSIDSVLSTASSNEYTLLDVDGIGPFDDLLARRTFSTTTLIRNNLP